MMVGQDQQAEQFYDNDSERFWDPVRPLSGRDRTLLPLIQPRGGTVLDYGFGAGSLLAAMVPHFECVIGAEISDAAIERCRTRIESARPELLRRIEFVKIEKERLSRISTESIDVVVCAAVIEHVFDPYSLLSELRRVAKPGASLILTTPNIAYIKHRLALLAGRLPVTGTADPVANWKSSGWDGGHLHYFTKSTLDIALNACGWRSLSWSGTGERIAFVRGLRKRFPSVWSGELIVRANAF